MTKHDKLERVYIPFAMNSRKLFPSKSMYQITKELNEMLEDIIYGKRSKR